MCGLAGIFSYSPDAPSVNRGALLRMRESMSTRGPDGQGLWLSGGGRVGLAHRRLAIIDLSENGTQPMTSADGKLQVIFNGEIYNYRTLRLELEANGHIFRTQSDTEVLLCLYRECGADMVHRLRGMFAFALWDEQHRRLLLGRDPFGVKPLYYCDDGRTFWFASQVKALLRGLPTCPSPDPAGHVGFFLWGYVPEPYTLYRGIRAVPAGSTILVPTDDSPRPKAYFSVTRELVSASEHPASLSPECAADELREAMSNSISVHLAADVPVGIFLSAGLDSGALVALASERQGPALHTFTLGFEEYQGTQGDETPLARTVAEHYGTTHRMGWVARAEFEEDLSRILEAMDQPSIDGVNTYFVAKKAAESGLKVALSGLGGDELFGGYPSFRHVPALARWLAPARGCRVLGRVARCLTTPLLGAAMSPKYAGLLEYGGTYAGAYLLRRGFFMPWEIPGILGEEMARVGLDELRPLERLEEAVGGIKSARLKVAALELTWYMRNQLLRDADWAGMAHSLEIRVPFVDVELLRRIAPLLASDAPPNKMMMARTPAKPLPVGILNRAKTGFSVPVHEWMNQGYGQAVAGERGLRGWAKLIMARQASIVGV